MDDEIDISSQVKIFLVLTTLIIVIVSAYKLFKGDFHWQSFLTLLCSALVSVVVLHFFVECEENYGWIFMIASVISILLIAMFNMYVTTNMQLSSSN